MLRRRELMTEAVAVVTDDENEARIFLATIRAARDGDSAAFEEIMLLTERRVALLAWRILGDAEEVKDAVQETFLRLFRAIGRYDERHDFFGWLYRIAVNVCRDFQRRRRRRRIFTPIEDEMPAVAHERRADDDLVARDDVALLTRAIDALPAKERLAVILREVEELPTEMVAGILGSSPATVRVQVSRARVRLRKWMEGRR
jgi:RNA polymerase sigma factor (sigma-70 family)